MGDTDNRQTGAETAPNPGIGKPVGPGDGDKAPTFEELVATPISEADARIRLADCDIQLAQCQRDRAAIDQRVANLTWVRTVILRQVLNPAKAEGSDA